MINYVFKEGKTELDHVLQLAGNLSVNGPLTVQAEISQVISQVMESLLKTGLNFECALHEPLIHRKDRPEAWEALRTKCLVQFKGK